MKTANILSLTIGLASSAAVALGACTVETVDTLNQGGSGGTSVVATGGRAGAPLSAGGASGSAGGSIATGGTNAASTFSVASYFAESPSCQTCIQNMTGPAFGQGSGSGGDQDQVDCTNVIRDCETNNACKPLLDCFSEEANAGATLECKINACSGVVSEDANGATNTLIICMQDLCEETDKCNILLQCIPLILSSNMLRSRWLIPTGATTYVE